VQVHIYSMEYKILRRPVRGVHRAKTWSSVERVSKKMNTRSAWEDFLKISKYQVFNEAQGVCRKSK
jgi:hypothetical protein